VRTIIDVRDAMEACWLAALRCTAGEAYNIGGDKTLTVGEFPTILKGLAKAPIPSRIDPALLRPSDVTLQVPDTRKFTEATGMEAEVHLLPEHRVSPRPLPEHGREAERSAAARLSGAR
jgi:nucleoside-diphosphate-sugar epimerase